MSDQLLRVDRFLEALARTQASSCPLFVLGRCDVCPATLRHMQLVNSTPRSTQPLTARYTPLPQPTACPPALG